MIIELKFRIDVNEDELERYYREFPAFLEAGETPAETFAREAIAAWDYEALLMPRPAPETKWEEIHEVS